MQFCPDITVSLIFTYHYGGCFSYNLDHSFHSLSTTRKFQICGSDLKLFPTTFTRSSSERLRFRGGSVKYLFSQSIIFVYCDALNFNSGTLNVLGPCNRCWSVDYSCLIFKIRLTASSRISFRLSPSIASGRFSGWRK